MGDVQQIAMARGARNQELFAQGVDGFVDNGDTGAELSDAAGIFLANDGLDRETVGMVLEFLKQVSGVCADPSDQPTRIDCHRLGQS